MKPDFKPLPDGTYDPEILGAQFNCQGYIPKLKDKEELEKQFPGKFKIFNNAGLLWFVENSANTAS
jgi:hypothetical protein